MIETFLIVFLPALKCIKGTKDDTLRRPSVRPRTNKTNWSTWNWGKITKYYRELDFYTAEDIKQAIFTNTFSNWTAISLIGSAPYKRGEAIAFPKIKLGKQ